MIDGRLGAAVGIGVMVVGVALLIGTVLADLPGLRRGRTRAGAAMAAAGYAVSVAAILGGAWLSASSR